MSFLPHILTTHEFWAGGFIVGALSSATTYISTRASDRRKAKQEDKVLDRKEEREDRLREHEALREAAMEFAQVSTDILTTTIDINGVFNMVRDAFYNQAGADDPKFTALGRRMADTIGATATVAAVPAAGHAAHLERPDAFAELVDAWLNQQGGVRPRA